MTIPFAAPTEDTILDIIIEAADGIHQPAPSTLNSASRDVKAWIKAANRIGRQVRRRGMWPCLNRRFTFATVAAQYSYDLPPDFDRSVFDAFWQSSAYRPMLGPLSAQEWEAQKNGVGTAYPDMQFQMSGIEAKRLEFMEDPGVQNVVFRYQSLNWILPTLVWAAGVAVTAGEFCQYQGRVYKALASGNTGATPPTHQIGSVSDGSIFWLFSAYEKVVEDGAICLIDRDIMILGIMWAWLQINGFDYENILKDFNTEVKKRVGALTSAGAFCISGPVGNQFFGWPSVPQTGWGDE